MKKKQQIKKHNKNKKLKPSLVDNRVKNLNENNEAKLSVQANKVTIDFILESTVPTNKSNSIKVFTSDITNLLQGQISKLHILRDPLSMK